MREVPTPSGITKPGPGRRMTAFASTICCSRRMRQADVEIFDLGRPILRDLDLDAAARAPTPVPVCFRHDAKRARDAILNIGGRAAAGDVEQPVVARVADATAERGKPALPHLVAERRGGRKFEARPLF